MLSAVTRDYRCFRRVGPRWYQFASMYFKVSSHSKALSQRGEAASFENWTGSSETTTLWCVIWV